MATSTARFARLGLTMTALLVGGSFLAALPASALGIAPGGGFPPLGPCDPPWLPPGSPGPTFPEPCLPDVYARATSAVHGVTGLQFPPYPDCIYWYIPCDIFPQL